MAADPQRDRIELICPECGQTQLEPALVVSTVCRSCRAHLQIREGRAVRRAQSVARIAKLNDQGQVVADEPTPPTPPSFLRKKTPSKSWWSWFRFRRPRMRDVCCLACGANYPVVLDAQSSQCPKCCTYASFVPVSVELPRNQRIDTRGNVVIHKKGRYYGPTLKCHHLEVRGQLDSPVECTGDLRFHRNARIAQPMRCGTLHIPRGVKIEFLHPVLAGNAIIAGEVRGELTCSDTARFEKRSHFLGLVRARSIDIKPGARFSGTQELLPTER